MTRVPVQVFIGWDAREAIAYHVLSHSILTRASVPVSITPLVQRSLREAKLYTRDRDEQASTEFSLTRFLVPYLSQFQGHSVYLDPDMLMRADISELMAHVGGNFYTCPEHAVLCVKHDYTPRQTTKFLGATQHAYPRKNWSSLMVFNNERCRGLMPTYVSEATPAALHRMAWAADEAIGGLPMEWNYLVGEDNQAMGTPRLLHWTNGGPWFDPEVPYAAEWLAERRDAGEPL